MNTQRALSPFRRMLLCGLVALSPLGFAAAAEPAVDAETARAQAAINDLGQRLRSALVARMQAEGPVGAVAFCHQEAPAIAASVASTHGLSIGRTSDRHRSPQNAPTEWQQAVLADFAQKFAAGAEPQTLEHSERGATFRYARGIRVEGPCLACHGSAVPAPVKAAIDARYPQDRATGYAEGDLRGLFWVEITADTDQDPRAAIPMSPEQAVALRAEMRHRLETQQRLIAALAAGDWKQAADAADEGTRGRHAGADFRSTLPEAWFRYARPMHQAFAAAREEARGAQRLDVALGHVARAGEFCTACHATFRTETASTSSPALATAAALGR